MKTIMGTKIRKLFLPLLAMWMALPLSAQRHVLRCGGRVVAHSLHFNPDRPTEDMPDGLRELLRAYRLQSRYAERMRGKAVSPLLPSVRHQQEPFNRSCPYYTDNEGRTSTERCVSGCVATCLEQVLSYYRYPAVLADTLHGWQTEHYTIADVLLGRRIDWEGILSDYRDGYSERQAQAVADLTYYCGMAVRMNWGLSSSGANLGLAVEPLRRVFGYRTAVHLSRALYATPTWNAMLRHELEAGRPVCYTGHNLAMNGHAFNIDGVDEEGFYHLNWGYGGDWDGYFDLDYLNPFESKDDATDLGQQEGLFCNQTALFLHPSEVALEIGDSLRSEVAFGGVKVEYVTFRRPPDLQYYTTADFTMTNTTADSLNFTFEVLTYLPTDTAIFRQADYVGLTAVNLAPGERRTWPVYCRFREAGERILAFSADDETLPFRMPVSVVRGTTPVLRFGEPDCRLTRYGEELVLDAAVDIANEAVAGYSGNLVTFCLFPEGSEVDERHWEVLSLAAGDTYRARARFRHLVDGQTYTLKVRSPWEVRTERTFTVNADEAADGLQPLTEEETKTGTAVYDLSGRRIPHPRTKGLYMRNGKKIMIL